VFFYHVHFVYSNGKNHGLTENLLVFTNKNGGVPVPISPFNPIPEGGACLKEIAA
jgi:hypothetical protein